MKIIDIFLMAHFLTQLLLKKETHLSGKSLFSVKVYLPH